MFTVLQYSRSVCTGKITRGYRFLIAVPCEPSDRCLLQLDTHSTSIDSLSSEPRTICTYQGIYYALEEGATLETPGVRLPSVHEFLADLVGLNSIIHHGKLLGE